jgi:hypothetical protein
VDAFKTMYRRRERSVKAEAGWTDLVYDRQGRGWRRHRWLFDPERDLTSVMSSAKLA